MPFSPEQLQAINQRDKNIIVSAGAGSGKTAVLTERISQILLSGHTLDELLVLTFTNKAAAEMKERVRKKILANKDLLIHKDKVDSANITTFDAYCQFIVNKYGYPKSSRTLMMRFLLASCSRSSMAGASLS